MKTLRVILSLLLMGLTLTACSAPKTSDKWDTSEMAGIADPGFSVVSKSKTNSEIKYLFKNVEVTQANDFLQQLYASEFKENVYYNYTQSFYSYTASNSAGKSINFEYNIVEKTASLTYTLSGSPAIVSGVMDMGYFIRVNFERLLDLDYKNFTIWLYYNINPEVRVVNQNETVISCTLKNFKIKSASSVGSLSISNEIFSDVSFTEKNCMNQGFVDTTFIVRQKGIGKVPANFASSDSQKPYFDAMSVSQSDLNFVVSFTTEIQTDKGTYTKVNEISVLPSGSDMTGMSKGVYDVDKVIKELSKGSPFTKN